MSDISLCKNETCTKKETCYRYLAKPNERWQSYLSPKKSGDDCKMYRETIAKDELKTKQELF